MKQIEATIEFTVPFYDVDAMSIVWHGHYVKYFERARCALLDLLDYNYEQMRASGYLWPVVDMRIKYVKPLKFQQRLKVVAQLAEVEYGLKITFQVIDVASNEVLTKAYTKQVAVDSQTEEMCLLSPDILHQKVAAYEN